MKSIKTFSTMTKDIKKISVDKIVPLLSEIRLKINCNFYSQLSQEDKDKLMDFLWVKLHDVWRKGPQELKIPTASTIGNILVNLAPFYPDDFMKSLLLILRKYQFASILYFSCFCYLSKFYSPKEIEQFCKSVNLFSLISPCDAVRLPKLTKELYGLPDQLLYSLVQRYFDLLKEDPDNTYIAQAAHIIISQNPESYVKLITPDTPVEIISSVFGDDLPKLDPSLIKVLSDEALKAIQDYGTSVKKFSASCKLLNSLITTQQVPSDIVQGIFTLETIQKTVSLEDLLLLPIESSIVLSIYGRQNIKKDLMSNSSGVPGFESGFQEDWQAGLDSNPNISTVFDSSTFENNADSSDMLLTVDDGTGQVTLPGTLGKDMSFMPSLPLPDFPLNSDVQKDSLLSSNFDKSNVVKEATEFDAMDETMTSSKSVEFLNIPPPSIPAILSQPSGDASEDDSSSIKRSVSCCSIPPNLNLHSSDDAGPPQSASHVQKPVLGLKMPSSPPIPSILDDPSSPPQIPSILDNPSSPPRIPSILENSSSPPRIPAILAGSEMPTGSTPMPSLMDATDMPLSPPTIPAILGDSGITGMKMAEKPSSAPKVPAIMRQNSANPSVSAVLNESRMPRIGPTAFPHFNIESSTTNLTPNLVLDGSSGSNNNSNKKTSFAETQPFSSKPNNRIIKHLKSFDLSRSKNLVVTTNLDGTKNILYQKSSKSGLLVLNPKYVSPLLNYFKRFPEYQSELINLILYGISLYKSNPFLSSDNIQATLKNGAIYASLKAVTETHSSFHPSALNNILYKVFEMLDKDDEDDSKNDKYRRGRDDVDVTLNVKILELIGTLEADKLTKKVANKMFDIIDKGSISRIDIIHKKAKKAFASLSNQTTNDLFKFFLNIYIQKLDFFNEREFSLRLSFLAYVMHHISNHLPLCFSSIASFLNEVLTLNNSLHRNTMLSIFKILTVFSQSLSNPQILIVFIQHAVNIIRKNYSDYTGNPILPLDQKVPFFNNHYQVENTLVQVDTDIVANPRIWHRNYLKCAHIAYAFLASIPWGKFDLKENDKRFLEQMVIQMSSLLPKETSALLITSRYYKIISPSSFPDILDTLKNSSKRKDDIIAFLPLYRYLCKADEKYQQLNMEEIIDGLKTFLPRLKNLTHDQAISVQLFLTEKKIDLLDLNSENLLSKSSSSEVLNDPNKLHDFGEDKVDSGDEEFDMPEYTEMLNDQELSSFIVSLTPLVYANLDVPPEFLQPFQVSNFCLNSTAAIDEDQCKQLFEYALSNSTPRVLHEIIRYSQKMHYNINIEENLGNPLLNTRRLFPSVFASITYKKKGFLNLSTACNQYIKQFYPGGFFPYVLNASESQHSIVIKLLQFDPPYFINQYLQVKSFTQRQLMNFCIYIQNVRFPKEPTFKFVIELLTKYSSSSIFMNIVRRIMSVFIVCYGSFIKRAPKQFYDIIACELGFPAPLNGKSSIVQKLSASDLVEIGHAINAIQIYMDCKELSDQIANLFKKNVPNYMYMLRDVNKKGSLDYLPDACNRILPSVRFQNIYAVSRYIKGNLDYNITSDFINNVVKLIDPYIPISNSKIFNDDASNCFFCFASCVLVHECNSSVQKQIFNLMFERMPFEISSFSLGRFVGLFKNLTNQAHLKNDIYMSIFQKLLYIIENASFIRPFYVDFFSSVSKQVGKTKVFCEKLAEFMSKKLNYLSIDIAEIASVEIMKAVPNADEAFNVLNFEIPDFFIFFAAVVAIEKKNRAMVHNELQKKYKGSHLMALNMLKNPKYRIFSPLIALIGNDVKIPKKLKDYLDSIDDKIQRIYSTDTYHEF